jgi:hypothetical protein
VRVAASCVFSWILSYRSRICTSHERRDSIPSYQDIVSLVDLPNNISAATLALAIAAAGSLKNVKTTPLLTVAQGISALKKAGSSGYTPTAAA